jgi:hypothetical protein
VNVVVNVADAQDQCCAAGVTHYHERERMHRESESRPQVESGTRMGMLVHGQVEEGGRHFQEKTSEASDRSGG